MAYIFFFRFFVYNHLYTNLRRLNYTVSLTTILYKNTIIKLRVVWLIILYSLYLGSWWALQEGSWGGWWNWDSSEVFGLLILCFFLLYLHNKHLNTIYIYKIITVTTWYLLTIFLYSILQISYTLVSHNFGLSILYYGYTSFNFFTISILLIVVGNILSLLWVYICSRHNLIGNLTNPFYSNKNLYITNKNTMKYISLIIVIYIFSTSFNPILNNLLWTSLNLNLLNGLYFSLKPQFIFLLLIYLNFFLLNSLINPLIYLIYYNHTFKLNLVPMRVYFNFTDKVLHLTIIILMWLPIYLNNTVFVLWDYTNTNHISTTLTKHRNFYLTNLNVNSLYISNFSVMFYNTVMFEATNSLHWINSDVVSQIFLLHSEDTLLNQVISNSTFLYLFSAYIYDFATFILDFMVTYSIPVLITLLNRKVITVL